MGTLCSLRSSDDNIERGIRVKHAFFAPAMDLEMYNSESTTINIKSLVERGNIFIKPAKGYLASGLNGEGRLEEPENIFNILVDHISEKLIYNKKNIIYR